jgi:hypothetical protein
VEAGQGWLLGGHGELLARASTFAPVPVAGTPQRAILDIDFGDDHQTADLGNEPERNFPPRSKTWQLPSKEAERQEKGHICTGERGLDDAAKPLNLGTPWEKLEGGRSRQEPRRDPAWQKSRKISP